VPTLLLEVCPSLVSAFAGASLHTLHLLGGGSLAVVVGNARGGLGVGRVPDLASGGDHTQVRPTTKVGNENVHTGIISAEMLEKSESIIHRYNTHDEINRASVKKGSS
jgi:hypothetical protein